MLQGIKDEDKQVTAATVTGNRTAASDSDVQHSGVNIVSGVHAHTDFRKLAHAGTLTPVTECQLNLLEHVEFLHQQISTRMDVIEKELDGNTHTHTHTHANLCTKYVHQKLSHTRVHREIH